MKEQLWRKPPKTIRVEDNTRGYRNCSGGSLDVRLSYRQNGHAYLNFLIIGPKGGSRLLNLELTAQDLGQLEELFREGRQSLESVTPSASQGSEGALTLNKSAHKSAEAA